MKDRTREAVFNLIGPIANTMHAVDLFAGTGAMGIEAVSRGASGATLIEIHEPSAKVIRDNVQALGLQDNVEVITADSFRWVKQDPALPSAPWLTFCCPPYRLYTDRLDDLMALLDQLQRRALSSSVFVVEADATFDMARLSSSAEWRFRDYPPARVAVGRLLAD